MDLLLTLFSPNPQLVLPVSLVGWIGWFVLLALILGLLWKWRSFRKTGEARQRLLFLALLLTVPLTSLLVGIRLPVGAALPPPGIPLDPIGPAAMIFSALPWMMAAGLLGPPAAALLGALSGLLLGLWDTHSLFAPLEVSLLAVLFSAAMHQRYRTTFFRLLREPLLASLCLLPLSGLLILAVSLVTSQGVFVNRLDYTLTHLGNLILAQGIVLLVSGLFVQMIRAIFPARWGGSAPLSPSPGERSLAARFMNTMAVLALILVSGLVVSDWVVAGNAARHMLRDRMANAAEMAAQSIPTFIQTGQNLSDQLGRSPELRNKTGAALRQQLEEDLKQVPFFSQLYVLDSHKVLLAGYPNHEYSGPQAPSEEQASLDLALLGAISNQYFTVPPQENQKAAQISFAAPLQDDKANIYGVLLARADLATNPFTQPVINSLNSLAGEDGQGILVDERGRILYNPNPAVVMETYSGRTSDTPLFYDDTAPNGTRRLVYYQPALGSPWAIILAVPADRAQEQALAIALPLLGVIALLALLTVIFLRFGLSAITGSLKTLAVEAGRIAQGQLDHPLPDGGEDEAGQLRHAFEQMRISLKARLEELNRLLLVSQGVASSLDVQDAVKPVLEAALANGASSARVVLNPAIMPDLDGDRPIPASYGLGPARDLYSGLDEQVLNLTRKQERLMLTNPSRPRLLSFTPGAPRPEALLAISLRHENQFYGTLWVAYDQPHTFSDEEVRFLITLAGQAGLAASNARLFLNAEIGRQRLAAILASTPDPVLVTDQNDCLLLANPAAWQVLRLGIEPGEGQPIEKVIDQKELVQLLKSSSEKETVEVTLPGGRTFMATASSVLAEGQRVGRVCVMQDVTQFKQLNELKSEFVSTVSHDLRGPLTLMRGYATMLEMVGELNDQQTGYVRKIISGVESMTRLVSNLLDLGRIEAGVGLQPEMVPVVDVVERVVGALQMEAAQKKIQLTSDIPEHTIPLVEADPALLQQALHNLVENAIKYTRAEGKVNVRVSVRQDRLIFEIRDTGIGISPMDQPRLFEKFFRGAQQASKDQRGTGLGLAIVKSIAERHGGQVWVESQLGKGSTFYMAIPLRQPKAEQA